MGSNVRKQKREQVAAGNKKKKATRVVEGRVMYMNERRRG